MSKCAYCHRKIMPGRVVCKRQACVIRASSGPLHGKHAATVLGPCCGCSSLSAVGVVTLQKVSPSPGQGWGCEQCGLPSDGAVAVLCGECGKRLEEGATVEEVILRACVGFATKGERVPYKELYGTFEHDLTKHPEVSG